jgi:hypothetical protein
LRAFFFFYFKDPIAWWIGQFLKFVLKPQPETKDLIENSIKKLGFKKPIVGVHVRRTDKVGTEAGKGVSRSRCSKCENRIFDETFIET